tara:strand:- start:36633 stop:37883 length:1251 start_codon:yes stop_codon:yes gene_type:complete
MKFSFIIIVIMNTILLGQSVVDVKRKKNLSNVEKFTLNPFIQAVSSDSLKVTVFIEIPYFSLQFVKSGDIFISSYEASISLENKKGLSVGYKTWADSIVVDSYYETRSFRLSHKYFTSFMVSKDQYTFRGELQDGDTRKRGIQTKKLDLRKLEKKPSIVTPIFLISRAGDWGFGDGFFPIRGQQVKEIGDGVNLLISGFVENKPYELKINILDKNDNEVLVDKVEDIGNKNFFSKTVFIPSGNLEKIKNEIKIYLNQGSKKVDRRIFLSFYKPGISNYVDDIDKALKQMKYILSNKERKEFKGKNSKEKKQLFYEMWKLRDPTPRTEFNELMEEYYGRVWFANENFDTWAPGWETDMGMIYILFGPPDDIQKSNPMSSSSALYQIWQYYRLNKQFVFKDQNGFGDFRLDTPYMGTW